MAATLIFVSGFRYYVGTDYGGYFKGFGHYAASFWPSLKELNEPGIAFVAKMVSFFSSNGMTFVFVCLTICYTALPISAVSNGDFYTSDDINSILSGNYNFSELTTGEEEIPFSFDNFPMKTRYTLDDSIYYIFLKSDATMLGYNGTSFNNINYTTSYSGSTHLWVLESVDSESFCLKWAQNANLCLTSKNAC